MKNKELYEKYEICGWPCSFLSVAACDKYNAKIANYCNRLPEGATELSASQELGRSLYLLIFLGWYDFLMFFVEELQWKIKYGRKTKR